MFNQKWFKLSIICFITSIAAQKINDKFLGCFLGENLLSLGDESRTLNPISPKACSDYCSKKKFTFFILKNDVCYCSNNYISRLMKQFDHVCDIKCTGDNSASCGGMPNLVSSYITDISKSSNFIAHGGYPIPIYLGCYAETPADDDNRLLKGPAQPFNNNTPQKCAEICFNMGYLYSGVTYGSECWCGNQQPSKSSKVDDLNCNSPCSGDNKQFCGGGWKMGIYSTGITDHIPKKYVGCFEDDEKKTKGKYLSYQMGNNNSPKRCMNLCNTQRFKYAAVKGNVCECKNYEPNFNLLRSVSECNTLCAENPSEYCGGSTSQNIYKTLFSDHQGNVAENNYIGCFNNLKRHPILSGWRITLPRLTPKYCVYSCFARRFPYAALISSKECICSFIKPHDDAKTEDNMCAISCSGAHEESCGGNNAMNVYVTGLEWKTNTMGNYYLGCFEESQNNRIFNSYSKSFPTNTPEFCSSLCYKFGYTYSGVTYKSECFCGNQSPNERMFTKMEDKQCNTKCSGDANQYCGGGWRMGVFKTGLQDFDIEERFLGCFVPQENTLSNMKFELINTNTPSKCASICNNAAYLFAGVAGVNCLCGNRAPQDDQKVGDSDCDAICVGDSSKTCGGEDRIQIYDLNKKLNNSMVASTPESFDVHEEFESLNLQSLWSHDIYIPQEPDYEFNIYNSSGRNSYVKNGELIIKPTILPDSYVKKGCLILNGCTKHEGFAYCEKNATSFNIIGPTASARLTTKNYLYSLYGKLEVVAKLPTGDWIVSEIAMVSKLNEQNKLVLATSFGNKNLKCKDTDESAHILRYGLKVDDQYNVKSKMMKKSLNNPWSDDYHSFVLTWTPKTIVFQIDGESNYLDTSNLPMDVIFESEYFISIGVSVGGMTKFGDGCLCNGHQKPWKNLDPKAMLNFWMNKTEWSPSWNDEKSTLRVKSVKFTTIDNIN